MVAILESFPKQECADRASDLQSNIAHLAIFIKSDIVQDRQNEAGHP